MTFNWIHIHTDQWYLILQTYLKQNKKRTELIDDKEIMNKTISINFTNQYFNFILSSSVWCDCTLLNDLVWSSLQKLLLHPLLPYLRLIFHLQFDQHLSFLPHLCFIKLVVKLELNFNFYFPIYHHHLHHERVRNY